MSRAVARLRRQAAAMRKQVAQRHLARHPRVRQAELRHELGDAIVPAHFLFADDGRHRRGGERLGDRGELEDGIAIDLGGLAHLADAEPLHIDDAILVHDDDGAARHASLAQALFDQLFELRQDVLHVTLGS